MKRKILFIDDITEFRQLTTSILKFNFDVEVAENGLEALRKIDRGYRPDLIVTDINMPEMDGEAFIRKMKRNDELGYIPIVVLSSIDNSKDRIRLLEEGVNDFIVKPFNPTELTLRINFHLKVSA